MRYLVIHPSSYDLRYTCTDNYQKPRLFINGSYIPLLLKDGGKLRVKGNVNNYKVGEMSTYISTHTSGTYAATTGTTYLTTSSSYGTGTTTSVTSRYY